MSKNRLEAFTDAVIAIIMTILVLELHEPSSDTWQALSALGSRFLIYIISFFTLVIYWNNHHHMFQVVHKVNGKVLWANSFFLFALSLFPFATSWISEYTFSSCNHIWRCFVRCQYRVLFPCKGIGQF